MVIALSIISILLLFTFLIELNAASRLRKRNEKQEEEIKVISNLKEKELEAYFGTKSEKLRSDLQKLQESNTQLARHIENELNQFKQIQEAEEKATNQLQQLRNDLQNYKDVGYKKADEELGRYRNLKQTHLEHELEVEISTKRQEREKEFSDFIDELVKKKLAAEDELRAVEEELKEERTRRAAINEEILRRRQVESNTDFYRICITDDDKSDIELLRTVAPRLQHPEAIHKIIWTGYYQKPLAELRKRLLQGKDSPGIYKITRLKTEEVYIGQTVSLDKRFQDHVKSALGVGTLTSSLLHRTMAQDGPEEFTFEILETCSKMSLREREAYYIDFYDSKNYGLNSVSGDKKETRQ